MDATDLIYTANQKPPFVLQIMLGLQHCLGMASTLILPLIIFSTVATSGGAEDVLVAGSMFAVGFGTLLMCLKTRFVGTGYLSPVLCEPAFLVVSLMATQAGGANLLFGMLFLAAFFQIFFALAYPLIRVLFPTEVSGIVVLMVGLSLVKPDLIYSTGSAALDTLSLSHNEIITAAITFGTMTFLLIWGKLFSRYAMLIGVIVGFFVATWQGLISHEQYQSVLHAPFFSWSIPFTVPHMKFNFGLTTSFAIASIAMLLKGVGGIIGCQKINTPNWDRPNQVNVRKMLFTNGLANLFSASFGGVALGVANNNIALACATGITSRFVGIVAGILMMIFALIPKITMLFVIMPKAIIGATMLFVTSYIIVAGIQILSNTVMDTRKIFIIGLSLSAGMVVQIHPEQAAGMPEVIRSISEAPIIVTTLVAICLNLLFRIGAAKTAVLIVNDNDITSKKLQSFLADTGRRWSASALLIQTVSNTLDVLLEQIGTQKNQENIILNFSFTEYELIVTIKYQGTLISLDTNAPENQALSALHFALMNAKVAFPELDIKSSKDNASQACNVVMKFIQ